MWFGNGACGFEIHIDSDENTVSIQCIETYQAIFRILFNYYFITKSIYIHINEYTFLIDL